ncbi:MAG TPA: ATP synthase F1 subunit gamma [Bacteroidota bacterium]
MATLREIRRRISGVKSIQKITKAMKMVAAARLRRAQEGILAARPYSREYKRLVAHLVAELDPSLHPLLQKREVKKSILVVVTSDRGLCGAFNTNVIKAAVSHIQQQYPERKSVEHQIRLVTIGKKGTEFFGKRDYEIHLRHSGFFQHLDFGKARGIMADLSSGYLNGEFDKVEVIYNEFKNVLQQRIVVEQLLPIPPEELRADTSHKAHAIVDYIYEPSKKEIIDALLPKHLNFQMWRILLESNAASLGAQMSAMDNATENAKELITDLTLSYNKARQASITKELLEIVGGAEALKEAS